MRREQRLALGLVFGVVLFVAGVGVGARSSRPAPAVVTQPSPADLFAAAAPSVVSVLPADGSRGAGVVVAPDRVLTARHLVVDQPEVELQTQDGTVLRGTVLGSDVQTDLALLRIEGPLPALSFAPADEGMRVGDPVLTVGNPFGLGHSLAVGVLSGAPRQISGEGDQPSVGLLQLSLATNPGNSGGPVLDGQGRLVGVLSGIHAEGQSIAFAVPAAAIQQVLPALERTSGPMRAFLGVQARGLEDVVVRQLIPGGPAAMAGVLVGDTLVSVDGEPVESVAGLRALVDAKGVGSRTTLALLRDGQALDVEVTLVDWRIMAERPAMVRGMTLTSQAGTGGRVQAVSPESPAAQAGVQVGDVVLAVSGRPMRAPVETQAWLQEQGPQSLRILRTGDVLRIQL